MTEPDSPIEIPDADRAEQEEPADPRVDRDSPLLPVGDREADEGDLLEQETDVPLDEDDERT